VVEVEDVPRPRPGPNDLLIHVRATTVSSADWRIRSLSMPRGFGFAGRLAFGISAPRQQILGSELSGDVVSVGAAVRGVAVGDAVIAFPGVKLGRQCAALAKPRAARGCSPGGAHLQAAAPEAQDFKRPTPARSSTCRG
jgi:NADPH:quinone reductase-like Zn-dependent oxidoreductase